MGETEQMHAALLNSFNPNAQLRKQAEDFVMQASSMPGAVKAFYEIAAAGHVEVPVRQAAAIRLKRIIEKHDWNSEQSMKIVKEEEKTLMKGTILECVSNAPKAIQKQLLEVVRHIVSYDFPAKWPTLGNELAVFLKSNNMDKTVGALAILRKLVKRYEAWGKERRAAEVNDVTGAFFPLLVDMFEHVNRMGPNATESVAEIQKTLLKIFFSSNYNELTSCLKDSPELLDKWMTCLLFVFKQPLDPASLDEDSAAWKAKKWGGYVLKSFIEKGCGHKKADKTFVQKWYSKYGVPLVVACADLLEVTRTMSMPQKTACRLIYCLQLALGVQALHTPLAPRLDQLVQEILFPFLCFSDDDLELWTSNPHEYTRKSHSVSFESDFSSASVFSMTYVINLCTADGKYHDKNTIFRFLQFLDKVLNETTNMADLVQMKRRYGALICIGGLRSVLLGIPTVNKTLEQLVVTHVFPSYTSQFGFMRCNSIWVVSRFSKLQWTSAENFKTALNANLAMIRDTEMPVRIQAGMSIAKLVANKNAIDIIKPILGTLVQGMFTLMNEIDAEELVQTLEIIIGRYGEDLEKESIQICQELITHFLKITNGVFDTDEYDMEAIAAGERCLGTISALVSAVVEKGDTVTSLQVVCIPLLQRLLTSDYIEFFDETMKLITILTVYCRKIAPEFWVVYDSLHTAFMTYADDMTSALAPFDNFISKEPEVFLRSQDRIIKLGTLCEKMLTSGDMHERDVMIAPKLIEVLLQHAKPYTALLDPVVGTFYDYAFQRLNQPKTGNALKVLLCNVILNGLWYNAPLTLEYLERRGITATFFNGCFSLLSKYQKPSDLKVVVLGMVNTLGVGVSAPLPAFFTPDMVLRIANECLTLTMKRYEICLKIDETKIEEESEEDSEGPLGMGMFGGAGAGNFEDDDDDDDDDEDGMDENAFQILCQKAREQEDDYDDYDEEQEVWSVIDEVSEAAFMRDYLEQVRTGNPQLFQSFAAAANQTHLSSLTKAAEYGEKQAREATEANQDPVNFVS